jgi:hypothetical protein
MAPHHPDSRNLTLSGFWLFEDAKSQLKGQSFETQEELFDAVQCVLNDFNPAMLQSFFEAWITGLRRPIHLKGDCIE